MTRSHHAKPFGLSSDVKPRVEEDESINPSINYDNVWRAAPGFARVCKLYSVALLVTATPHANSPTRQKNSNNEPPLHIAVASEPII